MKFQLKYMRKRKVVMASCTCPMLARVIYFLEYYLNIFIKCQSIFYRNVRVKRVENKMTTIKGAMLNNIEKIIQFVK